MSGGMTDPKPDDLAGLIEELRGDALTIYGSGTRTMSTRALQKAAHALERLTRELAEQERLAKIYVETQTKGADELAARAEAAERARDEAVRIRDEAVRQMRGYQRECDEVEQALGKVLGYPWYKDDPKNFPGATDADGVCIGDHVTGTLAAEAATKLAEAVADRDRLRAMFEQPRDPVDHSRLLNGRTRPLYVTQAQIAAAHPVANGSHTEYEAAMVLVGERHSKADLVELVSYFIQRVKSVDAQPIPPSTPVSSTADPVSDAAAEPKRSE